MPPLPPPPPIVMDLLPVAVFPCAFICEREETEALPVTPVPTLEAVPIRFLDVVGEEDRVEVGGRFERLTGRVPLPDSRTF